MEMICVVAIIIFLSAVALTSVTQYVQRSRDLKASIDAHSAAVNAQQANVEAYLYSTRARPAASQSENTSLQANNPNNGNNGYNNNGNEVDPNEGNEPEPTPNPTPEPTPEPTTTPTPTPEPTPEPTPTPAPANNNGGITVGNVTVTKYVTGDHEKGVVKVTGNGKTQTIKLQTDAWNQADFKITKNADNTYTFQVPNNDKRYWMDGGKFPNLYNTFSYTLNDDQKAYLQSTWGITLA